MTYPAANRTAQWFYDDVSGASMGPVEKVVWHTTEGIGWPGYDGGRKAPHYTVLPDYATKRMIWRAHFPDTVNSRAMRNESGGVQTNMDGALQVEIVGTCDQTSNAPAWTKRPTTLKSWALEPWQVDGLAQFVAWANKEHRVPLAAPGVWLAYGTDSRAPGRVPASYGDSPARMSGSTWNSFRGHCGHQHAPENSHGDPGRFPITAVFARAADIIAPGTAPDLLEELMADPKERAALIADITESVLNIPIPLMNYVDAAYDDADGKMSLAQLVQHAAGQSIAANRTAGTAVTQTDGVEPAIATLAAASNVTLEKLDTLLERTAPEG